MLNIVCQLIIVFIGVSSGITLYILYKLTNEKSYKREFSLSEFIFPTVKVKSSKIQSSGYDHCIKKINIVTCGNVYRKLKNNYPRFYENSPINGLSITIEYVDTHCNVISHNENIKTIVAIHGVPGNCHHFCKLINYYRSSPSVRIIAPNFPDFSLTRKTSAFWHSTAEKTQLLRDFLKEINVTTIDCFIAHSGGIYPLSYLWSDPQELIIKSLALLSPQPGIVSKYITFLTKFVTFVIQNKIGLKIFDTVKPHLFAHKLGYPMSYASNDEVLISVVTPMFAENDTFYKRIEFLRNAKIPTLFVYGENDSLIRNEEFYHMLKCLDVNYDDIINRKNDFSFHKWNSINWIHTLAFPLGGHFTHSKYSDIIHAIIDKLLNDTHKPK